MNLELDKVFELSIDEQPLAWSLFVIELKIEAWGNQPLIYLHEPTFIHKLNHLLGILLLVGITNEVVQEARVKRVKRPEESIDVLLG